MTTYDDMYPDAPADFSSAPLNGYPPVIKIDKCTDPACPSTHLCEICKAPTQWANDTAKVLVCSQECNEKLWYSLFMTLTAQQIVRGP